MARVKSSVVINNIVEVFNNEESNENKLVDFVSHVHLNADLSAIWIANGIKVAKKTSDQQFQQLRCLPRQNRCTFYCIPYTHYDKSSKT